MAATIRDVARLAGVSRGTVSRVLNNQPRVDPHSRVRVLQAIADLDFSPSALARGLSIGDRSVGDRMRLAAAVLLANPRRFATLGLSTAVFVVGSAVLTVVLLSTSLAIIALVSCRVVYPLADRMDPTASVPG